MPFRIRHADGGVEPPLPPVIGKTAQMLVRFDQLTRISVHESFTTPPKEPDRPQGQHALWVSWGNAVKRYVLILERQVSFLRAPWRGFRTVGVAIRGRVQKGIETAIPVITLCIRQFVECRCQTISPNCLRSLDIENTPRWCLDVAFSRARVPDREIDMLPTTCCRSNGSPFRSAGDTLMRRASP